MPAQDYAQKRHGDARLEAAFLYWFVAMHLLTATKKSISAAELQRQLGHNRYQPVWELLHKLRSMMGKRDDKYTLKGSIERDEFCYKFNRRYFGEDLFDRLVMISATYRTDFQHRAYRKTA